MANIHLAPLGLEEVRAIANDVLNRQFRPFGFGAIALREEEDFDGEPILRVIAEVTKPVPARTLIDATTDIHDALRKQGDNRFVYLGTHRPGDEDTDDEPEE
jgi:hypothetical protein